MDWQIETLMAVRTIVAALLGVKIHSILKRRPKVSFFKDIFRGMIGGHHGGRRYSGHHGGYGPDYGGLPTNASGLQCLKCAVVNVVGARFCQQCGAALGSAKCASCEAEIPRGGRTMSERILWLLGDTRRARRQRH